MSLACGAVRAERNHMVKGGCEELAVRRSRVVAVRGGRIEDTGTPDTG